MDFELSEDQEALVAAVQALMRDHSDLPQEQRMKFAHHDPALQALLEGNGFLDAARDIGPLGAALVTYECAKGLSALDTIGRGLIGSMVLPDKRFDGPVALVAQANFKRAIRNLPIARSLLVDCGNDVALVGFDSAQVEAAESILAFPYGRFVSPPRLADAERFAGLGPLMRQWWRVGIAAEIAGAATAAIDFTIDYVKQRHVFGRPVGSFQAVQHRLVQRFGFAKALYYLAMRAAWSGEPVHADIAACFAQSGINALLFDLHQFNGAMGVTTEHSLHFWTYRIRAMQSEAGGLNQAALGISAGRWGEAADNSGHGETGLVAAQ